MMPFEWHSRTTLNHIFDIRFDDKDTKGNDCFKEYITSISFIWVPWFEAEIERKKILAPPLQRG
jgi:hypothetical protein